MKKINIILMLFKPSHHFRKSYLLGHDFFEIIKCSQNIFVATIDQAQTS